MIDIHVHLGQLLVDNPGLTPSNLLRWMDRNGIEKRDAEFGLAFLKRWKRRLMFATDYLRVGQETPIIDYIRTADLDKDAYERIVRKNAAKVFRI